MAEPGGFMMDESRDDVPLYRLGLRMPLLPPKFGGGIYVLYFRLFDRIHATDDGTDGATIARYTADKGEVGIFILTL